jgi:uncharacterized protein YndB with AHSA1/START domain
MIKYPEQYQPARTAVFVSNSLKMEAPPETVWAWLVRADLWSSWYPNARNMSLEKGESLKFGTRFRWKTFSVTVDSVVEEFVPGERIAWTAKGIGVDAYHAWLIEKRSDGCFVLTEETQNGWLARIGNLLMPNRMHSFHQIWLEGLQKQALSGFPPQIR